VPGGTFFRSYDGLTDYGTQYGESYPATVSPFTLDVYEVTVARFRNFVNAYDSWSKPAVGSGRNPNDPDDTGWASSWDQNLQTNAAALKTQLACSMAGYSGTWTDQPGANETLPITCLDWFTAYAFCVWDGARLPTEAEWNFAASGGSEQRVYPWSSPPTDQTITSDDAVYNADAAMPVGSKSAGMGKWGHLDLAGNADEWVRDWFADPYPTQSCVDCATLSASSWTVERGGTYFYDPDSVSASYRDYATPTPNYVQPWTGVRCARSTANLDAGSSD
jgi:formylglycine-generating enzyme required for sulfatase activity